MAKNGFVSPRMAILATLLWCFILIPNVETWGFFVFRYALGLPLFVIFVLCAIWGNLDLAYHFFFNSLIRNLIDNWLKKEKQHIVENLSKIEQEKEDFLKKIKTIKSEILDDEAKIKRIADLIIEERVAILQEIGEINKQDVKRILLWCYNKFDLKRYNKHWLVRFVGAFHEPDFRTYFWLVLAGLTPGALFPATALSKSFNIKNGYWFIALGNTLKMAMFVFGIWPMIIYMVKIIFK